jgi:hypothetical protein
MNLLGSIGLWVLILVGYSIGRILLTKRRRVAAELRDGVIIALLWSCAALVKLPTDLSPHLAWILIALFIGIAHALVIRPEAETDLSEYPEKPNNFLKWLWQSWKSFAFRMGNFQGRLILMLFYFTILMPFGIINSVFRDPLHQRRSNKTSYWFELHSEAKDIQDARRQF